MTPHRPSSVLSASASSVSSKATSWYSTRSTGSSTTSACTTPTLSKRQLASPTSTPRPSSTLDEPPTPRPVHQVRWPFFPPGDECPPTPATPVTALYSPQGPRFFLGLDSPVPAECLPCRDENTMGDHEEEESDDGIANCLYFRFLPTTGPFARLYAQHQHSPQPRIKQVDPLRAYLEGDVGEEPTSSSYPRHWKSAERRKRNKGERKGDVARTRGTIMDDAEHPWIDPRTYYSPNELEEQELPVGGRLLRPGEGCASRSEEERGECVSPRDTRVRI